MRGRVRKINFVAGAFVFSQRIQSDPVIKQEQGSAAYRFPARPSGRIAPGCSTATATSPDYNNLSAALFGQLQRSITDRLRLLPGLRPQLRQRRRFRPAGTAACRRPTPR
jgi:iron complex outermembrane receptor protein